MTKLIAIDLTPLRPGGENGGAKTLTWELLKYFHELAPDYTFLLLTKVIHPNWLRRMRMNTGPPALIGWRHWPRRVRKTAVPFFSWRAAAKRPKMPKKD
jgi:hypothetical protein